MAQGVNDYDGLTLQTVAGGALEEKFQIELDKVLLNIADPNVAEGKREITLKISLKPNSKGTAADVTIKSSSTLQPDLAVETMAFLGKEGVRLKAFEHDPEQYRLPMQNGEIQAAPKKSIGGMS